MTAVVAEILVGSIQVFAEQIHVSDFFVAAVIVAIVGNAAEHGGAVVVARRGQVKLATEIALSSSAQVAVFLIPMVAVISWAINPLSFAFRQVEIGTMAGAAILAAAHALAGPLEQLARMGAHRPATSSPPGSSTRPAVARRTWTARG